MANEQLRSVATGKPPGTPSQQVQHYFNAHRAQIDAALPKHLNADRMCRLALTAFHQNKDLMQCDPKSVFASVVIASQMGLEIGVAGQGYLVPYKGKCTFIPGWQGLVDLVSRAGRATVWTGAVFAGDDFEWALGDRPYVKHRPMGEDDPSKLLFTYAVGRVNGSEWPVIEVWSNARLLAHRKKNNKVGGSHYSFTNWEMYARKIPLLQVLKYMPKSIEVQNAIAVAEATDEGKSASIEGNFVIITDDESPAPDAGGDAGRGSVEGGTQGTERREPDPSTTEKKDVPLDHRTAAELSEKKKPSAKEVATKAAEKATGAPATDPEPKLRSVIDMDGSILFNTDGDTEVGAKGAYKNRPYTVVKITDSVIQVEYDPAKTTSVLDDTKLALDQAETAKDLEVALVKLDEARSLFNELLPENQEKVRDHMDRVAAALKDRASKAL